MLRKIAVNASLPGGVAICEMGWCLRWNKVNRPRYTGKSFALGISPYRHSPRYSSDQEVGGTSKCGIAASHIPQDCAGWASIDHHHSGVSASDQVLLDIEKPIMSVAVVI